MKKKIEIIKSLFILIIGLTLFGCSTSENLSSLSSSLSNIKEDYDMSDITFKDKTYIYDGKSHALEIEGDLPNGVEVTYSNNNQSEVGTYEVVASFVDTTGNYNVPEDMKAYLTIEIDSEFTYTIIDNEVTITGYIGNKKDIAIPSYVESGGMYYKVTSIGDNAFRHCTSLTSITIPNSVTSIGDKAFYNCSSLESIVIPDSVTSIGYNAFYKCTSLTSITLPFIGQNAAGSGKTHFGYIFGASSYDENYSYIPTSLKEVKITNCTSIGDYAFYECRSIKSITLPNTLKSIGFCAFSRCSSITSITLPFIGHDAAGSGKTHFGYIFGASSYDKNYSYIPTSLKEVKITNCTSIDDYAFYECRSIKSITIPNSVTSIGNCAFYNCYSLTIYCEASSKPSGWDYSWNPSGCGVFFGVTNYIEINGIVYVVIDGEGIVSRYIGTSSKVAILSTIEINGITYSVTSIGEDAFYNCSSLESIVIPEGVTSIGAWAFYNCSSLESIVIPDSVTSIGVDAFDGCNSLKYNEYNNAYYLGNNENPYLVLVKAKDTTIISCEVNEGTMFIHSNAFYNCSSLKSITISDSVTSIGARAFYNCSSIENVYFTGSQEQWNAITINSNNLSLTSATITYNYVVE